MLCLGLLVVALGMLVFLAPMLPVRLAPVGLVAADVLLAVVAVHLDAMRTVGSGGSDLILMLLLVLVKRRLRLAAAAVFHFRAPGLSAVGVAIGILRGGRAGLASPAGLAGGLAAACTVTPTGLLILLVLPAALRRAGAATSAAAPAAALAAPPRGLRTVVASDGLVGMRHRRRPH
eukprot:353457-Chlamydomonas_euryale.AAC.2